MEWLNQNSLRKYPFTTDSDMEGIPDSVFVDALLSLSTGFQYEYILREVRYTPEYLYVSVARRDTLDVVLEGYNTNGLILLSGNGVGKIIVNDLTGLEYGSKLYSNIIFEPKLVTKLCSGISSLNGITEGNILFTSGTNVSINTIGNVIKIDTIDGLCACNENKCIKTINGIPPDSTNNFRISSVGCLRTTNETNGILLENICETACCGCEEINDMIQELQSLQKRIVALGG